MGLSGALLSAMSGLRATQHSVDLVARNVANVDTPGYTRKTLEQVAVIVDGQSIGVRSAAVSRSLDQLMQTELRSHLGEQARLDALADTLASLDALFGIPGGAGAIDTMFNDFAAALQDLSDSPESSSIRAIAVTQAQVLASGLNGLSAGVQGLRQTAEDSIGIAVVSANEILDRLADLNARIVSARGASGIPPVDLLDQRDTLLAELSSLMDIRVQETGDGRVRVFTGAGHTLVDGSRSVDLVFDAKSSIGPNTLYDPNPDLRGVGTIYLDNGSGQRLDLFRDGAIAGGSIAGYRELRDDILVTAQAQLDELAHGLASALSERLIAGSAVTVGLQDGFEVDLAALRPGDEVTLTYTQTPPGETRAVTIVRVDDPGSLPLGDDATARPDDTVVGIDFSNGVGAAAAALGTALGGALDVSSPGGSTLRILDDGIGSAIDIVSLEASVTATSVVDQGLGLPLFTDGPAGTIYTGSLDGAGQKAGFAARIAVNPAVVADDSTLVAYSTSPPTPIGDQARPLELFERLSSRPFTFSPSAGLGSPGSPISETVGAYARRVITAQTGVASGAELDRTAQQTVTRTLEERIRQESGVDIDEELTRLISLEQSYAANARIISVVQELMDALRGI